MLKKTDDVLQFLRNCAVLFQNIWRRQRRRRSLPHPGAYELLEWPVPPLPHRRGGHGVVLAGTVDVFDSECSGKAIVTINN